MSIKTAKFLFLFNWGICLVFYIYSSYFHLDFSKVPTDFINILTGARMASDSRVSELYSLDVQAQYQEAIIFPAKYTVVLPFRMVPVVAEMLSPLGDLGIYQAGAYLLGINIGIIIGVFYLLYKDSNFSAKKIIALSFLIYFQPIWFNFYTMQFSIIILLIFFLIYFSYKQNAYFLVGLLLGLLLIKPNFLLFVPIFLILNIKNGNNKSIIYGFIISFLVLVGINSLLYGTDFIYVYPKFLLLSESSSLGTNIDINFNVSSLLNSVFLENYNSYAVKVNMFVSGILYLLFLAAAFRVGKGKLSTELIFSIGIIVTVFLNLHTMPVDLVVLWLPILLFTMKEKRYMPALIMFLIPLAAYAESFVPLSSIIGLALAVVLLLRESDVWDKFSRKNTL